MLEAAQRNNPWRSSMLIACLSCRTQCHNQLWLGIQVAIIYSLSTMGSCELLYIAFFSMFQNMHGNYILQLFYTLPIVYLVKTRPPWNLLNLGILLNWSSQDPSQLLLVRVGDYFLVRCVQFSVRVPCITRTGFSFSISIFLRLM